MIRISVVILAAGLAISGMIATACAQDDIPTQATGASCQDPNGCPMVGCDCADNSVVLAQHCINFRCQTADDTCPTQCAERGGWTHRDAGEFFCAGDDACPALTCRCANGQSFTKGFCNQGVCAQSEGEACWNACMDAGGFACGVPGDSCAGQPCCFGSCDENSICVDTGEGPRR